MIGGGIVLLTENADDEGNQTPSTVVGWLDVVRSVCWSAVDPELTLMSDTKVDGSTTDESSVDASSELEVCSSTVEIIVVTVGTIAVVAWSLVGIIVVA